MSSHILRAAACIVVFAALIVFGSVPETTTTVKAESSPKAEASSRPASVGLASVIDGSGRIVDGTVGSFDARGFQLGQGPNGEPVFKRPEAAGGLMSIGSCTDDWDTRFNIPGTRGTIRAMTKDAQGNIYFGGTFTEIGTVKANNIVKWDGVTWTALDAGVNGTVNALAVSGTDLYVGGSFTTAGGVTVNNIAKWNGSTWSALGSGTNGSVNAIAISGSNVYLGGSFTTAGGSTAQAVALWNGSSWSAWGGLSGTVNALAVSGSTIYVGGSFSIVSAGQSYSLASWNGSTWRPLYGTGGSVVINALAISGTDIYIGGSSVLLRWDGTSFIGLGSGVNGSVSSIEVSGSDVFVGGAFTTAGGTTVNRIAKWNGSTWSALGSGTNSDVRAILLKGNDVYAGGSFTTAGDGAALKIARWDGASWQSLRSGLNGRVYAVAVSGTDVYVGGSFTTAGGVTANRIAKWNGSSWSALGSGMNGDVYAIAVSGADLYAGGAFTTAGGITVNRIAKWDGSSWSALSTGLSDSVYAIAVSGTDVLIGGAFTLISSLGGGNIVRWNGTAFSSVQGANPSVGMIVNGIAVSGGNIYAVGYYGNSNGQVSVGRFGSPWTIIGYPSAGVVSTVAVAGSDVFIGGSFTSIGGVVTNGIAKYNGSWAPLGSGNAMLQGAVSSIAVSGSNVYAAGDFTQTVGGTPMPRIAKWNGTSWSPVGGGMNDSVYSLALSGTDIFAGGNFTSAGCYGSAYFARYYSEAFTGLLSPDWHTAGNWTSGTLPPATANLSIDTVDVSITTADAMVRDLQVNEGRTLTVAAGRKLTVSRSLTINGKITGGGTVEVTNCDPNALARPLGVGSIETRLVRCVNGTGTFVFPVGTANGYSPVTVSNALGSGNLSVQAVQSAGTASGLPTRKINRYWTMSNLGLVSADLAFTYLAGDVPSGGEETLRLFKYGSGAATFAGGSVDIASRTATVTGTSDFASWTVGDAAEGCVLTPTSNSVSNFGGSASIAISAQGGCAWTAASNDSWITIASGASGTTSGTLTYNYTQNFGAARTGTITVAGKTFTLSQGSGCSYSLSSSGVNNVAASGANGSFTVNPSTTGCPWTATSDSSWLTVVGSSSGSGTGSINYVVAANTGPARTGTITAGGRTFTVTQLSGCSYTLSPASPQSFGKDAGTLSVGVASGAGCPWSASSNASWMTVSSGSAGTGNGTVSVSVSANTSVARTGTLTIAGQTYTVNQASGCSYALTPSSLSLSSDAGSGSFSIATNSGCSWTATSQNTWITVNGVSSGSGAGNIAFSVSANSGPVRTGTISVSGTTFTVTQAAGSCLAVALPTMTVNSGTAINVPINVGDTTNKGIASYDFEVRFDPAVIQLASTPYDVTGTLSSAMTISTNIPGPGRLVVSGFGAAPTTGAGVLLNLKFTVVGAPLAQTSLTWNGFTFNEGDPCSTPSTGQISVALGSVAGSVRYYAGTNPHPMNGLTLTVAGPTAFTAVTNSSGAYLLADFPSGSYTVTPSKTGQVNGISSFDAARIAQYVALLTTFTPNQLIAGDVSGNGSVSSFDASQIAQYVIGVPNTGLTGQWKFSPTSRSYSSVTTAITGDDYAAILVGDVSGNWSPNLPLAEESLLEDALSKSGNPFPLGLGRRRGQMGEYVRIPVTVGDITNKGVAAFDIELSYDPEVLEPVVDGAVDNFGTLSANLIVTANPNTPGRLIVSAYGIAPMSGEGTLINLVFRVKGTDGARTRLKFERMLLNEDKVTVPNGTFTVGREVRGVGPTFRRSRK